MSIDGTQSEVFAHLRRPRSWPAPPLSVEVIETHGALIFMAGEAVLKVKRAVRLPYLDFTSLEARRNFCRREIEINQPFAPDIYQGVVAVTREPDGTLAIGGQGVAIEWAVAMQRFDQHQLLSNLVTERGLSTDTAKDLADMAMRYHRCAPRSSVAGDDMPRIVEEVVAAIGAIGRGDVTAPFAAALSTACAATAALRGRRGEAGKIRRCHGDLHLANIVMWQGRPVPFDAIEFDEQLATIDVLYDLAFLLMDLERHGARAAANVVLNRYLWRTGDLLDLEGLAALPLYLATRAGIRAMVALDRAKLGAEAGRDLGAHAIETLKLAVDLAGPSKVQLVAVGGLSGTGKSTLAAALAPLFGAAPGALHIRTDLERKWIAGVEELAPLPETSYTPAASAAVYARTEKRTKTALAAGHSVVVDGVFARDEERQAMTALAQELDVPFTGLWLEAAADVMTARVAARTRDASDATALVVQKQIAIATGPIEWTRIETGGSPQDVLVEARRVLRVD